MRRIAAGFEVVPGVRGRLDAVADLLRRGLGERWRGYDAKVLVRRGAVNGTAVMVINADEAGDDTLRGALASVRRMHEAKIEETETGLQPADDGWWILNASEIGWFAVEGTGTWSSFESPKARSPLLGIGIHVLWPGQTPGYYHAESNQEGFLVLSGECLAIVEGQERRMGQWDYLHCPPGTAHITIGAGDGPCAILMVGTRAPDDTTQYIADPVAARHGAAVAVETDSSREAYKDRPPIRPARSPWPLS